MAKITDQRTVGNISCDSGGKNLLDFFGQAIEPGFIPTRNLKLRKPAGGESRGMGQVDFIGNQQDRHLLTPCENFFIGASKSDRSIEDKKDQVGTGELGKGTLHAKRLNQIIAIANSG